MPLPQFFFLPLTFFCSSLPAVFSDGSPPTITILGNTTVNILLGSIYVDAGATAVDARNISLQVTVTNSVNTSAVGFYNVTYRAVDAYGNVAQIARLVRVYAPPLVLVLTGPAFVDVIQGNSYTDLGAVATGGTLVVVGLPLNTSIVGNYTINYTVTGASGARWISRTVSVLNASVESAAEAAAIRAYADFLAVHPGSTAGAILASISAYRSAGGLQEDTSSVVAAASSAYINSVNSNTSGSGSSAMTGIVIGVVAGIGVVTVIVALVLLRRRMHAKKQGSMQIPPLSQNGTLLSLATLPRGSRSSSDDPYHIYSAYDAPIDGGYVSTNPGLDPEGYQIPMQQLPYKSPAGFGRSDGGYEIAQDVVNIVVQEDADGENGGLYNKPRYKVLTFPVEVYDSPRTGSMVGGTTSGVRETGDYTTSLDAIRSESGSGRALLVGDASSESRHSPSLSTGSLPSVFGLETRDEQNKSKGEGNRKDGHQYEYSPHSKPKGEANRKDGHQYEYSSHSKSKGEGNRKDGHQYEYSPHSKPRSDPKGGAGSSATMPLRARTKVTHGGASPSGILGSATGLIPPSAPDRPSLGATLPKASTMGKSSTLRSMVLPPDDQGYEVSVIINPDYEGPQPSKPALPPKQVNSSTATGNLRAPGHTHGFEGVEESITKSSSMLPSASVGIDGASHDMAIERDVIGGGDAKGSAKGVKSGRDRRRPNASAATSMEDRGETERAGDMKSGASSGGNQQKERRSATNRTGPASNGNPVSPAPLTDDDGVSLSPSQAILSDLLTKHRAAWFKGNMDRAQVNRKTEGGGYIERKRGGRGGEEIESMEKKRGVFPLT